MSPEQPTPKTSPELPSTSPVKAREETQDPAQRREKAREREREEQRERALEDKVLTQILEEVLAADTVEETPKKDARVKNLKTFYQENLGQIDNVQQALTLLADPKVTVAQKADALAAIQRALNRCPPLRGLSEVAYKERFPLAGSNYALGDLPGEKDEFRAFRAIFDKQNAAIVKDLRAKIAHLDRGGSIQDPAIQVDRGSDAYKKLVDAYRKGGGFDRKCPAEKQPNVPLPPSTSVVTISADTAGKLTGSSEGVTDGLSENAMLLLANAKPGELSVFDAYRKSVFLPSEGRFRQQIPLYSPAAKGEKPGREAAARIGKGASMPERGGGAQ